MASSIREALESAVSSVQAKESALEAAPTEVLEPAALDTAPAEGVQPDAAPIGETTEQRTERLRDEKGRFAEGKPETEREKKIREGLIKPAAQPAAAPATPAAAPAVAAKLPKPDSWKKERQADWDALTPSQQAYVKEREDQYFKGISTYQQEWKGAKPLLDAVAPFLPELQRHNIEPATWITNLGRAHHTLATGDGQSKLQMFAKLAQDYGVPLQALYDPNFAQQYVQQAIQQPQQPAQQQDVATLVRQEMSAARTQDAIEQFEAAKDAAGQPLYPHFQTVKSDMALLLEAGKAQDLKSAYSMALRLHDDLWQEQQSAQSKAQEAARLEASRKAVAAAKGSAVSVKSATPASAGSAPQKGIRSNLEAAWDQHATGRV